MEKKQMYAAVAAVVVVIIVVAAGVWYMTSNNGGSNESSETGDSYYFYLDGMEDLNGWYTAQGSDAEVALKAALDEAGIEYNISNGWMSSIGDCVAGAGEYYIGTYVYTANTVETPSADYFVNGSVLNESAGNIIYVTYSTYTMDEYGVMFYDVNPHSTTDANLMSTGPFASDSYSPLSYDDTYWFYLDGMEDLNGWYTAQGSDAEVALKAALDEAGIEYNISNGWVSSIGECIPGVGDKYIGSFVYTSNTTDNAYQTYFGTGPALNQAIGNIVYLTYSTYTFVDYTMSYDLNPYNTTSDLMTTGPFATA